VIACHGQIANGDSDVAEDASSKRLGHRVVLRDGQRASETWRAASRSPCAYRITPAPAIAGAPVGRRERRQLQQPVVPTEALRGVAANQPEEQQLPDDRARLREPVVFDQPAQPAPERLEIVAYAIEPLALRETGQFFFSGRRYGHTVACESVHREIALSRGHELDLRIRAYGFEHVIQRSARR
jgi:hypothetical protein